jgi:hypothetical protein
VIGKLELNFVSPELVTDSSMIGMLSSSIVDISPYLLSIDLSIFSNYCALESSVANLNLSSVDLGTLSFKCFC